MLTGRDAALCCVQTAVLGDVSASGELLAMTQVGDLDVDMVEYAKITSLIVPQNAVDRFVQSGRRHRNTSYYGAQDIWEAIWSVGHARACMSDMYICV